MVWCKQSCRRRTRTFANRQWWFPRNLGEPCSLLGELPAGSYRITNSRPWRRTCPPGSETNECNPRYRQAKGTKCGRMAAGRHSVLIVLMKLANSPQLEPMEGSGTPIHGTVFEKHVECFVIRKRVHETGTDSRVGETVITAVSSIQGACLPQCGEHAANP